jgi:hypothetical protein
MPAFPINDNFLARRENISEVLTPNATQRVTLIVAGVYILVIGILWYVSLNIDWIVI